MFDEFEEKKKPEHHKGMWPLTWSEYQTYEGMEARVKELDRRIARATAILAKGIESDISGAASKAAIAMLATGDDEAAMAALEG